MAMLTVSIVTYNTDDNELRDCLRSLESPIVDRIVVIDNSRSDSTKAVCESYPKVTYIPSDNVGYGRGHNIALQQSLDENQRYHLVLNSDVTFDPSLLERIASFMDANPDVGTIQPALFYPNGSPQYSCRLLPTPFDLIIRRFLPDLIADHINDRYLLMDSDRSVARNLPQHQGSFMFMRVDALREVGIFDPRYFLYGEDVDLSRRIYARYKALYWPEVTAIHTHREESYYKLKPLIIHMVNICRYFNKWGWFFDPQRRRWNRQILEAERAAASSKKS